MPITRTFTDLCNDAKTRIREISADELHAKLAAPPEDWVLIDVR